jgi:hypothetical protein
MKIPKGWRRLRNGTVIKRGDKLFNDVTDSWVWVDMTIGMRVVCDGNFIRRLANRRSGKGGK